MIRYELSITKRVFYIIKEICTHNGLCCYQQVYVCVLYSRDQPLQTSRDDLELEIMRAKLSKVIQCLKSVIFVSGLLSCQMR
jgi:hypothetical protein